MKSPTAIIGRRFICDPDLNSVSMRTGVKTFYHMAPIYQLGASGDAFGHPVCYVHMRSDVPNDKSRTKIEKIVRLLDMGALTQ